MNDKEKLEAIDKESSWQKIKQTDKEKIEEALRLLDKILRAKKEEYGFSYPELNSGLVHGHFIKIKEILEK